MSFSDFVAFFSSAAIELVQRPFPNEVQAEATVLHGKTNLTVVIGWIENADVFGRRPGLRVPGMHAPRRRW
jgi:hypothetical protein